MSEHNCCPVFNELVKSECHYKVLIPVHQCLLGCGVVSPDEDMTDVSFIEFSSPLLDNSLVYCFDTPPAWL